jgi:hypothetical protein
MALDIVIKSIHKQPDGLISLAISVIETVGNKQLDTIDVQGTTAQEIEDKLRPRLQAFKSKYDAQKALETAATARINLLKTELGIS